MTRRHRARPAAHLVPESDGGLCPQGPQAAQAPSNGAGSLASGVVEGEQPPCLQVLSPSDGS